jgi:hypothetical protein
MGDNSNSSKGILAGIFVIVVGGVILAIIVGEGRFAPPTLTPITSQEAKADNSPRQPQVATVPTYTAMPTYTPYPTSRPAPTNVPTVAPTATSVPTEIPQPTRPINTSQGTSLDVGQPWKQDGLLLTLVESKIGPNDPTWNDCTISAAFDIHNLTSSNYVINVQAYQFSAKDNLGNNWPLTGIHPGVECPDSQYREEKISGSMDANGRFPNSTGWDTWRVGFRGDITNKAVDYVVVTVTDLLNFNNAQWKIAINN